jgi:septal ring factor EnvC (AmiA/AmiB activator)
MKKNLSVISMGAGVALVLGGLDIAEAKHYARSHTQAARQEIRQDWREIQRDRAELRRDVAELRRDRIELGQAIRRGASREEIARRRDEVRQDIKEIRGDRRELRESYGELRGDLKKYGWRGRGAGYDRRFRSGGNHFGWGYGDRYSWRNRGTDQRWDRRYSRW